VLGAGLVAWGGVKQLSNVHREQTCTKTQNGPPSSLLSSHLSPCLLLPTLQQARVGKRLLTRLAAGRPRPRARLGPDASLNLVAVNGLVVVLVVQYQAVIVVVEVVVVVGAWPVVPFNLLGLADRLVIKELRRVLVLGQWQLVQQFGPLEVSRAHDKVDEVDRAVVLHGVQVARLRNARGLVGVRAVVVQLGEQVRPVFIAEKDDVHAVEQRVAVRHENGVHEDERARAHGLPQSKISLPVGRVDRDDDARVEHLLEVALAQRCTCRGVDLHGKEKETEGWVCVCGG